MAYNNNISYHILFDWRKTLKKGSKKAAGVVIRITKEGKTIYLPTGVKVPKNAYTNRYSQWIKSDFEGANALNLKINRVLDEVRNIINECDQQGIIITKDNLAQLFDLKKRVQPQEVQPITRATTTTTKYNSEFTDSLLFMQNFIEERELYAKKATLVCYKSTLSNLKGCFPNGLLFSEIGYNTAKTFEAHLKNKGLNSNSIREYFSKFITCLREAANMENIPFESAQIEKLKGRKIQSSPTNRVKLTLEQVKAIEALEFTDKIETKIRDLFLFECYTGLRISDIKELRKEHIVEKQGVTWIEKKCRKTGEMARIPISELFSGRALELIQRYSQDDKNLCFRSYSATHTSSILNVIAAKIGVNSRMGTHTARHSFSSICVNQGISLNMVQFMLGHKNISSTNHYATLNENGVLSGVLTLKHL